MSVALSASINKAVLASEPITRFDWVSMGIAVAGLVVTVVGFWVALVQIKKTRDAADAATRAALIGTHRIRYNQLLMVQPQMSSLEVELDAAVQHADSFAVERILLRWRQLAAQSHGVLAQMGTGYSDIGDLIDKACENAIRTKGRVAQIAPSQTLQALTLTIRKEISTANDRLGSVVNQLATEVPGDEGNQR